MTSDYYRGYAAGRQAMQPDWKNAKKELPPRDGHYYVIAEAVRGFPGTPMGSVVVDTAERWSRGKWIQNEKFWKVLYWAFPPEIELPEEIKNRSRIHAA